MNIDPRTIVLTSPAGRFFFTTDTILSHAKLVRDTITAVVCDNERERPPTAKAAQRWFREHVDGPAKDTQFRWEPA